MTTVDAAQVREFVAARLHEDERACRLNAPGRRYHNPAWGLQLIAVLRGVLAAEPDLRLRLHLAAIWSDHPAYRPEWRRT